MKKFARFFIKVLNNNFSVCKEEFVYGGRSSANMYLLLKPAVARVLPGPPSKMFEHVKNFKKKHPDAYLSEGRWFVKESPPKSSKLFIEEYIKNSMTKIREMGIDQLKIREIRQ